MSERQALGTAVSDWSGRGFYNFTNNLWQVSASYSQVGDNFNPEVGFLPRKGYYNGDFTQLELTSDYRFNAKTTASVGWTRQDITLPNGAFVVNLVPVKASYSFTPLASLSVLAQYTGQSGTYSANVRLALLNRSARASSWSTTIAATCSTPPRTTQWAARS